MLVVDNEADARGLVSAILESRGAEVTAVESAAEALADDPRSIGPTCSSATSRCRATTATS